MTAPRTLDTLAQNLLSSASARRRRAWPRAPRADYRAHPAWRAANLLPSAQAISRYARGNFNGPFVQDVRYITQYYELPEQKDALAALSPAIRTHDVAMPRRWALIP